MIGKAAKLGARAVDMAGPEDRPGHVARVGVDELQLAQSFLAAVVLALNVVVGFFRLREPSSSRVEDEVGGNEDQLLRQVFEDFDILTGVFRIVPDAVDDQVEGAAQGRHCLLETICILAVRLHGGHPIGNRLLPPRDSPHTVT